MRDNIKLLSALLSLMIITSMCFPVYASTEISNNERENVNASTYGNIGQGEVDETDVLLVTMMMLNDFLHVKITKEMADNRIFIPLYDDDLTVEAYYMEFEGAGYAIVNNNKLNPVAVEVCAVGNEGIRAIYDQNPSAKIIYDGALCDARTVPIPVDGENRNYYRQTMTDNDIPNEALISMLESYHDVWEAYVEESRENSDDVESELVSTGFAVTELSDTDVLIMAHEVLFSDDESMNYWPEDYSNNMIVPLYDDIWDVVAYYISFENGGFAVVNNNSLNPVVIEYGETDNPYVKALIDSHSTERIIYDNPFSVRTPKNLGPESIRRDEAYEVMQNYHYFNTGVDEPDAEMARILYNGRETIENLRSVDFNDVPNSDAGAFINRLYEKCLLRSSDIMGFTDWLNVLYNPTYGGGEVARGFFLSQEYVNRGRTNGQFLTDLYDALFNRDPDSGGYSAWLNLLETGYMTREQVINGFTGSQEFIALCASFGVSP